MKTFKYALVLLLTVTISISSAQIVSKGYNTPIVQAFLKGKTYAILTDDGPFNQWLQSTLQKQWTVNPIEFIRIGELDSLLLGDKNFFLFPSSKDDKTGTPRLMTNDDLTKKKEFYVVLSQGGYKQPKLLFSAGTSGAKVLGSFRYGPDRAELAGGMTECEMMLSLLNQSLQVINDKKIKSEVKDSVKWVITDENAQQIKEKVLLVNRAYVDGSIVSDDKPLIIEKILDDYPYDDEVIGKDSVQLLFDDPSGGNYCYLFLYYPSAHFKTVDDCGDILVYDPSQKKMLYFGDNLNGAWFEKWKMKEMVSMIKAK